jgi:hypothetical protein
VDPNLSDSNLDRWREDEVVLGLIGKEFSKQATRIEVRIPQDLAIKALASWQRDIEPCDPVDANIETPRDQVSRTRSGTLALIGICLESGFVETGDGFVAVEVDAWQIGDAADELGLL